MDTSIFQVYLIKNPWSLYSKEWPCLEFTVSNKLRSKATKFAHKRDYFHVQLMLAFKIFCLTAWSSFAYLLVILFLSKLIQSKLIRIARCKHFQWSPPGLLPKFDNVSRQHN